MDFSYFFALGVPNITSTTEFSSVTSNPNQVKIHKVVLSDQTDNIIREVYPSINKSGEKCMYDLVTKTYYYNYSGSNTGCFEVN